MIHTSRNNKVNIVTLGCSKNLVDSEVLINQLKVNNLEVVHNAADFEAKTVVINTCGFIREAKEESINTILQYIRAKEEGKINRVFVIGCLSQRYKKELKKEIPEVDKYFGVNDLRSIIETIGKRYRNELIGERELSTPSHYAYLKISEGCDRTCSFCAIPIIRGRYISRPIEEIIQEAKWLSNKGVKELILIAQDLTYYGVDLYKSQKIADLLLYISDIENIEWIRLHYTYPASFPREIISVIKERNNICKYLDLPIQHINNKILRNMKRNSKREELEELIQYIREEIPSVALRTTLLVGHPGEEEKEFNELRAFVQNTRFERLGIFTYSEEEGTYSAKNFSDCISQSEKQRRAGEIMLIQQEISSELNNNRVGGIYKVLVEGREGANYIGRTEYDSPEIDNEVIIDSKNKKLQLGNFYNIKITSANEFDLFGKVS